jgi:hypothetical protein
VEDASGDVVSGELVLKGVVSGEVVSEGAVSVDGEVVFARLMFAGIWTNARANARKKERSIGWMWEKEGCEKMDREKMDRLLILPNA